MYVLKLGVEGDSPHPAPNFRPDPKQEKAKRVTSFLAVDDIFTI